MRLSFAHWCGFIVLTTSMAAYGQGLSTATNASPQGPAAPAAPAIQGAAPGPFADDSRSLFAPVENGFELSGRLSSIEGDPARWQRYEDLRDGVLFTGARVHRETADWTASAGADNVGWRDQRFFGSYARTGRLEVSGLWDQIPQFYSIDTRTPFAGQGDGVLILDDNAQRAASHNAYLSISPQFELRERRDIGAFRVSATPSARLDFTGRFTTTKHSGELPWGADFGFSNDNEVALPYRSRTNDVELGGAWTNQRALLRAAYSGSWFENQDDTLTWDNPLVLADSATAPGRGRTALWPSNSLQTVSTGGYARFARRTQLTGSVAFGWWNNDEPLLPFTVNAALPQLPLPRATTGPPPTRCPPTSRWSRARTVSGGSARASAATITTTTRPKPRSLSSSTTTRPWPPA
jgi:hypothetical protein